MIRVEEKAAEWFDLVSNSEGDGLNGGTCTADRLDGRPLDKGIVEQESPIAAEKRSPRELRQYRVLRQP